MFYSPETDVVACLAGCSHVELLRAFGLPEQPTVIGLKMGSKSIGKKNTGEGRNESLEESKEEVGKELPLEEEIDVCMADVQPQEVEWLIEPYIPLGKFTIVEGDPDEGKSFAMLAIAAAIARGGGLPFGNLEEAGNVILLSAEDGRADTIRPRLDSLDADINRIYAVTIPLTLDDKGYRNLEQLVELRQAKMVLFDPLFAYVGGKRTYPKTIRFAPSHHAWPILPKGITARLSLLGICRRLNSVTLRWRVSAASRGRPRRGASYCSATTRRTSRRAGSFTRSTTCLGRARRRSIESRMLGVIRTSAGRVRPT